MNYDYKTLIARQMNGPIVQSVMQADHELYRLNDLPEWFEHRRTLSLETATTEELDAIGAFLGIPRPYCTTGAYAVPFKTRIIDGLLAIVDANTPYIHVQERIEGVALVLKEYQYTPNQELLALPGTVEISRYADDDTYRLYIQNMAGLRRSKSLMSLADMLYTFNDTGTFEMEFQENGDILLFLDEQYKEYEPFLQVALDLVYNALPHIGPIRLVEYSQLVVDNTVRTQYAHLVDPDWLLWEDNGTAFVSCINKNKIKLQDDGLIEGTDKTLIYGDNGVGQKGFGIGFHKNTLYLDVIYGGGEKVDG